MVEATRVVVDGPAELLFDATGTDTTGGATAVLIPVTGTAPVYLGGPGVTHDDGVRWDPELGPLSVALQAGEELYAAKDPADPDQEIHVLGTGK